MARKKPAPPKPEFERLPNGAINNCARANFAPEKECQICGGACPDRKGKLGEDGFPIIEPVTPSAEHFIRMQKAPAEERTIPLFEDAFLPSAPSPVETDRRRSVETREVSSRYVCTVDADSFLWQSPECVLESGFRGSLVRLRAPDAASDARVEQVRKNFEEAGAERVIVLPRRKPAVVPSNVAASISKKTGARQAVGELLSESNSKNRRALAEFCDALMTKNGL